MRRERQCDSIGSLEEDSVPWAIYYVYLYYRRWIPGGGGRWVEVRTQLWDNHKIFVHVSSSLWDVNVSVGATKVITNAIFRNCTSTTAAVSVVDNNAAVFLYYVCVAIAKL